jgi:hypothetical protein
MQLIQSTKNRLPRAKRRSDHVRPVVNAAQARARRSGGPQDQALYSCECGFAFKAAVTTSVGCPHCGTAQAW